MSLFFQKNKRGVGEKEYFHKIVFDGLARLFVPLKHFYLQNGFFAELNHLQTVKMCTVLLRNCAKVSGTKKLRIIYFLTVVEVG
jgi:hypothetical protein